MSDDDLIELIAPGGCDEANHGTVKYRVDNNGRVRVPREAAQWFIRYGGFRPYIIPICSGPAFDPATFNETTAPQKDGDGAEQDKPIPATKRTRGATEE